MTTTDLAANLAQVPSATTASNPFRFERYLCATDGYSLIAVPSDSEGAPCPQKTFDYLPGILHPASVPDYSVDCDVAELVEWCALPPCEECRGKRKVTCSECSGLKEVECSCKCGEYRHEVKCEDCGGTGKQPCYKCMGRNPGTIGSRVFDRTRIARILEILSLDGSMTIRTFKDKDFAHFVFGDSVAVLMQMRGEEKYLRAKFTPKGAAA